MIEKIDKEREFVQAGGQTIDDTTMLSKGITLLAHTEIFNDDIREWQRQATDNKTWKKFRIFFHQEYCKKRKAVTTAGKGGYTAVVHNIYGVPPPPPEEHHEAIDHIAKIVQGMQMQIHNLEGMSQANAFLNSSNTAIMAQWAQITVTMNAILAHLKTLAAMLMNQKGRKEILLLEMRKKLYSQE